VNEGGDFIKHEVFQALPELEEKLEVGATWEPLDLSDRN
jgi:hypothetical protein